MDELKYILSSIEKKIDKVDEKLESLEKITTKQEINLREHMIRTATAEENLALLRKDFEPIEKHALRMQGAIKVIGSVSIIAGIIKLVSLLF